MFKYLLCVEDVHGGFVVVLGSDSIDAIEAACQDMAPDHEASPDGEFVWNATHRRPIRWESGELVFHIVHNDDGDKLQGV